MRHIGYLDIAVLAVLISDCGPGIGVAALGMAAVIGDDSGLRAPCGGLVFYLDIGDRAAGGPGDVLISLTLIPDYPAVGSHAGEAAHYLYVKGRDVIDVVIVIIPP